MKKFISLSLCSLVTAAVLVGCGKEVGKKDSDFDRPSCSSPDVLKLIKYKIIETDYQLQQSRGIGLYKNTDAKRKDESNYHFKSIRSVLSKSSANEMSCSAILIEDTFKPLKSDNKLQDINTIEYNASYSDDGKDLYVEFKTVSKYYKTPYGYVTGF